MGYQGKELRELASSKGIELEIVKRSPGRIRIYNENWEAEWIKIARPSFEVLPRRWVVERTFAWLGRYRRMHRDYEYKTSSSETTIYACHLRTILKHYCKVC